MYSKEVMDHFLEPRNVGSMDDADGFGVGRGGELCPEDLAHFWIRVRDGRITEVKQKTRGCPVAIASSSIASVMALGMSLHDAQSLTEEQVAARLGDISERKLDSLVGPRALLSAIEQYVSRLSGPDDQVESQTRP